MRVRWLALALVLGVVSPAGAAEVVLKDPTGDDDGPGGYVYPTDAVYKQGNFDLTELKVSGKGKKVDFDVTVNQRLEDSWRMETGFSLQNIFVFINTGDQNSRHFTEGIPGLNVTFAAPGWDRVVVLSPQTSARVKSEVESKVPKEMQAAVVVPTRVKGFNRTISASVPVEDLGGGDPASWSYQVVMQSNEGFPAAKDLLTRKVNEFEGQHRFGGGTDFDCDPHAMDVLAGKAEGAESEIAAQHEMLKYECGADGTAKRMAELKLVKK